MKVFVAGPRALKTLGQDVEERLNNIIKQNITVLVGDANGVDKMVQQYLDHANYKNVEVYASNGKARNNIGDWVIRSVPVTDGISGFEFYAMKDKLMAEEADYGFMIWNGKSKGTLNNMINLTKRNKTALIYFTPHKKFYHIKDIETVRKLSLACGDDVARLFDSLSGNPPRTKPETVAEQISWYEVTRSDKTRQDKQERITR